MNKNYDSSGLELGFCQLIAPLLLHKRGISAPSLRESHEWPVLFVHLKRNNKKKISGNLLATVQIKYLSSTTSSKCACPLVRVVPGREFSKGKINYI